MKVIDYNGTAFWSLDAVLQRYEMYARRFGIDPRRTLKPLVHESHETRWVYPVMNCVIEGIEAGDLACAEIGVEFIEENSSFPFGRILKWNTARALRRCELTPDQQERIRMRVAEMLRTGYLPREFRQYAKLAREIGLGEWLSQVERGADMKNVWVRHYLKLIRMPASGDGRV